jgi:uncharacterized protein
MGKIILMLVLLFAVLLVLRLLNAGRRRVAKRNPPPAVGAERMLACTHCGALVPGSEAVVAQGKPYCSSEHAAQTH